MLVIFNKHQQRFFFCRRLLGLFFSRHQPMFFLFMLVDNIFFAGINRDYFITYIDLGYFSTNIGSWYFSVNAIFWMMLTRVVSTDFGQGYFLVDIIQSCFDWHWLLMFFNQHQPMLFFGWCLLGSFSTLVGATFWTMLSRFFWPTLADDVF